MSPSYHIGTSGWHYDHWRGVFYPSDLPRSRWLQYYCRSFSTVELNNTFYRLASEKAFRNWRESSPEGFVYALKVSRYITHVKKLRDCAESVANFLSRARLLGNKLGPVLYQTPPDMKRNDRVLEEFLALLPGDTRHVFEFRHESWLDHGVLKVLRRFNAGFCVYDMPDLTTPVAATSDFAYFRFHGSAAVYSSEYSDEELQAWARRIADLGVRDTYVYFNNDAEGLAVSNALKLKGLLGQGVSS